MSFSELVNLRRSCRSFLERPLERDKIIRCLEAARMAPSACNSQPWRFVVVDHPEKVQKLSPLLQSEPFRLNAFTKQAPVFVVVVEEPANLAAKFGGRFKDQEFASIDIGLAVENFCLAAAEQGLGNCIIGWFAENKLRRLLGIPKGRRIRLVIALGYPAEVPIAPKARKPAEKVYGFNQY
jgi:nitroreductase